MFEYLVYLLVFYPLFVFVLVVLSSEKSIDKVVESSSILYLLYSLLLHFYYLVVSYPIEHITLYSVEGLGEIYGFIIDPFSVLVSVVIGVVSSLILYYAVDYMSPLNNYHPIIRGKKRYYAWMYLFVFAVMFFVYSSNLVQMLIAFELMSLACWGLISYYGGSEAERSAFKMLIITHLGAYGGLAPAIFILINNTGNSILYNTRLLDTGTATLFTALILWAAVTKSSQFPTYSWLPDAMVAPTPTSALLHGATMIEMGPYLLARTLLYMNTIPGESLALILFVTTATLIIVLLTYPGLRDGKRLLAYSTIAEVAFMYYAVALMGYSRILGLFLYILHFTIHAFIKSLGFLLVGYAGYSLGTHLLDKVVELFSNNRLLSNSFTLVLFGLSGIPLIASSKIYILFTAVATLSNPFYLAGFLAVFMEAFVFLLLSMRIYNGLNNRSKSGVVEIPVRMETVFILLLILLYVFQINCYTIYRQVLFMVNP